MTNAPLPPRLKPLFFMGVIINWAMAVSAPVWAVQIAGEAGWFGAAFMALIASINTYRLVRQRWQDNDE